MWYLADNMHMANLGNLKEFFNLSTPGLLPGQRNASVWLKARRMELRSFPGAPGHIPAWIQAPPPSGGLPCGPLAGRYLAWQKMAKFAARRVIGIFRENRDSCAGPVPSMNMWIWQFPGISGDWTSTKDVCMVGVSPLAAWYR
jgi:hypothetical protein